MTKAHQARYSSVPVSRRTFERIRAAAAALGMTPSQLVETLVVDIVSAPAWELRELDQARRERPS